MEIFERSLPTFFFSRLKRFTSEVGVGAGKVFRRDTTLNCYEGKEQTNKRDVREETETENISVDVRPEGSGTLSSPTLET